MYRQARKAEKQKPEAHERDEGELERTGQTLCVYEIYDGEGAWSFLHRGSLYRGISLVSCYKSFYAIILLFFYLFFIIFLNLTDGKSTWLVCFF